MKRLTPELIEKARNAKSAEELFELAKANNAEITEDMAKTYFAQLNAKGSVSDEELDAVVGGGSCPFGDDSDEEEEKPNLYPCPECGEPSVPAANAMRRCIRCAHRFK